MNRYDGISSLLWFVFSILIIIVASSYSVGTLSRPGPGFLPLLCGAAMAFFSGCVFFQAFLKRNRSSVVAGEPFLSDRWRRIALGVVLLVGFALFVESLGFMPATFVFLLLVMKFVGASKWRTALIESVLATVCSWILFEVLLKVTLPRGFWSSLFS
jgi:putative tricarboxylic transport membrane protein